MRILVEVPWFLISTEELDDALVTATPYTSTALDKLAQLKHSQQEKVNTISKLDDLVLVRWLLFGRLVICLHNKHQNIVFLAH